MGLNATLAAVSETYCDPTRPVTALVRPPALREAHGLTMVNQAAKRSEEKSLNVLKNPPKSRLRRKAHGSIRIQEGEPN
jgi:hypothetical protein